jgi:hypothetical protein
MSRFLVVGRLVARDLRNRPGQAVLMLLAITAATATLTLGLVQGAGCGQAGSCWSGPSPRGSASVPGTGSR